MNQRGLGGLICQNMFALENPMLLHLSTDFNVSTIAAKKIDAKTKNLPR
jgi:hypothetical protein